MRFSPLRSLTAKWPIRKNTWHRVYYLPNLCAYICCVCKHLLSNHAYIYVCVYCSCMQDLVLRLSLRWVATDHAKSINLRRMASKRQLILVSYRVSITMYYGYNTVFTYLAWANVNSISKFYHVSCASHGLYVDLPLVLWFSDQSN